MTISRFIVTIILASSFGAGCSQPATLDEALAFYQENKLDEALPLFEKLATQEGNNPEHYAWLAETYRRLGKKEEAVKTARRALELDPCSSFAHTVIAEASNPIMGEWAQANSDTTWFHLLQAIECDSGDGNPWVSIWSEAIHRGEHTMMRRALQRMVDTGFLTKAILPYGRWMLRALPENAILITNGDMDTYPPCALQEVEGFRKDIVIVNRSLLNTTWYARFIRDYAGVSLPITDAQLEELRPSKDDRGNLVTPSDKIFRGWLDQKAKGSLTRPLAVAVTVDSSLFSSARDNMRFSGAFFLWHDAAMAKMPDTTLIRVSLEGVSTDSFTGPWVNDEDRSPIRRVHTKNIVRNVTVTAISYSELLLEAKRFSEANRWVSWADELDRKAELGPVFTERIARVKERLEKH